MIQFNPPVVKPYAPALQPIAFASVAMNRDEVTGRIFLLVSLFDVNKTPVNYLQSAVPAITQAQFETFLAAPATPGDTIDQTISRRALPILATTFGLTGVVMPSVAATPKAPVPAVKPAPAPVPTPTPAANPSATPAPTPKA